MPYQKITIRPGINTMATQLANEGGWSQSNLIRYRQGFLEKIGGWAKLFSNSVAGLVRALHAYEDLSANKNLVIGTDAGLQAYVTGPGLSNPILANVKLARRTDTALYAGTNAGTLIGMSGSSTVTVVDIGHGASVGDQVAIPVPISIGGIVIQPQTVNVASVTTNNWTFVNSQNLITNANTAGSFGTPPVFTITSAELNTTKCRVVFPAHGLSVNSSFQVQYGVVWQNFPGGVSVPPGTYTVASVIDANTFTITTPGLTQGALASGAEGGIDLTQPSGTIDGLLGLVYYVVHTPISPNGAWYVDNFGGNVIIGLGNGSIYQFVPPISSGATAAAQIIANAPLVNAVTFVAMPQAQIIALGSESVIGSGVQDPLMVRWCDAANPTVWTASITNQAGSFRLSRGSLIVGGIQAPQTTLVWTDIDLWAMTYIQPPLVYSFTILGAACGLIAPKARVILGRNTYWMGQKSFWTFGDNGVQRIECPIWDTVFPNLSTNPAFVAKIFAGANEPFGEVLWFFPSTNSTGECDSYVKFNPALGDHGWDYGLAPQGGLSRTAWLGVSVFGMPLSTDLNLHVMQHETGTDNDVTAMSGVYAETGFFDIAQGDSIPLVNGMIPDIKWTGGSGASLTFTLWGQDSSGDEIQMAGPYTVTPTTHYIPARMRKRQIALRVDWAPVQGFSARLGAIRARIQPAGRRP